MIQSIISRKRLLIGQGEILEAKAPYEINMFLSVTRNINKKLQQGARTDKPPQGVSSNLHCTIYVSSRH